MELGWRQLSDNDREREYSPSSCIDDIAPFLEEYVSKSASARAACEAVELPVIEIRYGPARSQTIDLITPPPSGRPCPLLVFIHGGYWQALSKSESFFPALDCLDHGFAFAAVDYTLAPEASLDQIVDECRTALTTLVSSAEKHGIDPERVVVTGSSAGAHLAAMTGLGGANKLAALVLVSGIFELEPLIGTSINKPLRLDVDAAQRNSPLLADLAGMPETIVAYGDNETTQFKRQSGAMAAALRAAGIAVTELEIAGRNHFDVVFDLCRSGTTLGEAVIELVERTANVEESS